MTFHGASSSPEVRADQRCRSKLDAAVSAVTPNKVPWLTVGRDGNSNRIPTPCPATDNHRSRTSQFRLGQVNLAALSNDVVAACSKVGTSDADSRDDEVGLIVA